MAGSLEELGEMQARMRTLKSAAADKDKEVARLEKSIMDNEVSELRNLASVQCLSYLYDRPFVHSLPCRPPWKTR